MLQPAIAHTLLLTGFTLIEYIRSGRIWIELGACTAFYVVFLRSGNNAGIDAEKFFSLNGIFLLALTIYTMSAVIGLGDRPQGYVLLSRHIGRASYLLGLYLCAIIVLTILHILLSLATFALSRFTDLTLAGWFLGTLPLLLNIGLMAALLLLLSPLVFSTGWRLFVLGLIALAFSGNFLGNATIERLPGIVQQILSSLQTILGWPMIPAFSGFALSMSRDYSGSAPVILIAQASLLFSLLGLSVYSFSRREIVLNAE